MTDRFSMVGVSDNLRAAHKAGGRGRHAGFQEEQGGGLARAGGADVCLPWSMGVPFAFLPLVGPAWAGRLMASALASTVAASSAAALSLVDAMMGLSLPESGARRNPEQQASPPSEAENLRRWRESGAARQWVAAHQGQWGHAEWLALLDTLRSSPYWPMHPDAVGAALEEEKRDWLARKEDRTGEGQTVQVREEQLHARKQPVETGVVRVRKEVVTELQTFQVPVIREEVVIERRPASGRASAGDIRSGEEIRIPVKEERVHVEKEAVLKEEVSVGKRIVTDVVQVSGTVRKEQVKVEQEGAVNLRGNGPSSPRRT